MTRARPALVALFAGFLLALGLAACGGQQIPADEVAAPPPELTIPSGGADALAGDEAGTSSTGTGTTSTTEEGAAEPSGTAADPSAGGTGAAEAPAATATPAPTAAPQQDSAQNDAPPPAGSGAQKFEEFCEQNAGAC